MDARFQFVLKVRQNDVSLTELARRYGISRKTAYKWLHRYEGGGLTDLGNRSHRPRTCPHATPEPVVKAILQLRERHPSWGAPKLRRVLTRRQPNLPVPSVTTVHAILVRHSLVPRRRRRMVRPHPGRPLTSMDQPNAVWTADYKGQFKTGDGRYCFPLTVQDGFSRYLLACRGLSAATHDSTYRCFQRLFSEHGLPDRIRTDNGSPFASCSLSRLSRLSVWWLRLGIRSERIEPGKPQQNGRHERMHRTLKAETARPPKKNLRAQQRCFDDFRHTFNQERPHQAIGQETPASLYRSSKRVYPSRLPPLEYPGHFQVRQVGSNGCFRWHSRFAFIGLPFNQQHLGLEETGDGIWSVYLGSVLLGNLDERDYKITQ